MQINKIDERKFKKITNNFLNKKKKKKEQNRKGKIKIKCINQIISMSS